MNKKEGRDERWNEGRMEGKKREEKKENKTAPLDKKAAHIAKYFL